jgi:hypothetical protein
MPPPVLAVVKRGLSPRSVRGDKRGLFSVPMCTIIRVSPERDRGRN